MIEVRHLTKRFGSRLAVDDLSFEVAAGTVTGLLGPNGSGKSTTLRCMLGLDRPQQGTATFGGRRLAEMQHPLREVGALLDAGYVHPGRSARDHLRWIAASNGFARTRVDECLEMVGLRSVAHTRVRRFSLGMRQRLGLAAALLGDPSTVLLDEPANGLDPEGIRWIRDVLVHLAGEGRAVLVSSHLLSEMSLMASELVVIARGRLLRQGSVQELLDAYADHWVQVTSPKLDALLFALGPIEGLQVTRSGPTTATLRGIDAPQVGEAAARAGVVLHELSAHVGSLEDAFLTLTAAEAEFVTRPAASPPAVDP